jgi:poly-gamma-glutamate synthesis protein (capsule biosynthesis protein)
VVVLNAVGDIAYPNGWGGIDVVDKLQEHLFDNVRPILDKGDLNFANIECPLTYVKPKVQKTYPISCDPKRLNYVLDAGFDVFSTANNHAMDAGKEGLEDTIARMKQANRDDRPVWFVGTGKSAEEARAPLIFTVPGKKTTIAMFALSASGSGDVAGYQEDLPKKIAAIRSKVDVVIVSVHAGVEYEHEANADQAKRYRSWIDAGADVVLGHHPHVVQGVEHYKKGLILYSMGNFSFGSKTKRHLKTGARMYSMIATVKFRKGKLVAATIHPLWASNTDKLTVGNESCTPQHCQPQPLKGNLASHALSELQAFSDAIPGNDTTKITDVDDQGVIDGFVDEAPAAEKPHLPSVVW